MWPKGIYTFTSTILWDCLGGWLLFICVYLGAIPLNFTDHDNLKLEDHLEKPLIILVWIVGSTASICGLAVWLAIGTGRTVLVGKIVYKF